MDDEMHCTTITSTTVQVCNCTSVQLYNRTTQQQLQLQEKQHLCFWRDWQGSTVESLIPHNGTRIKRLSAWSFAVWGWSKWVPEPGEWKTELLLALPFGGEPIWTAALCYHRVCPVAWQRLHPSSREISTVWKRLVDAEYRFWDVLSIQVLNIFAKIFFLGCSLLYSIPGFIIQRQMFWFFASICRSTSLMPIFWKAGRNIPGIPRVFYTSFRASHLLSLWDFVLDFDNSTNVFRLANKNRWKTEDAFRVNACRSDVLLPSARGVPGYCVTTQLISSAVAELGQLLGPIGRNFLDA